MRRGSLALILLCAAVPALAAEVFVPYRQTREDGVYIDWLDGQAGVTGRATSYRDLKVQAFYRLAREDAAQNGRTRLLSFIRGIPIDGARRLGDDPVLFERVKKSVTDTEPERVEVADPSTIKASMKIPLAGDAGLLGLVLPAAEAVAPAAPPAAQPAAAAGGPTGLVLDATKAEGAVPSLLPRIVDEQGRLVFGPERVDLAAARARGMAAFASRVEMKEPPAALTPRQGSDPLRVTALRATGPGNTEFVVSAADADRILKEEAVAGFLRNCRVLIVLPPAGPPSPRPGAALRQPQQVPPPARPRELGKPHRWD